MSQDTKKTSQEGTSQTEGNRLDLKAASSRLEGRDAAKIGKDHGLPGAGTVPVDEQPKIISGTSGSDQSQTRAASGAGVSLDAGRHDAAPVQLPSDDSSKAAGAKRTHTQAEGQGEAKSDSQPGRAASPPSGEGAEPAHKRQASVADSKSDAEKLAGRKDAGAPLESFANLAGADSGALNSTGARTGTDFHAIQDQNQKK